MWVRDGCVLGVAGHSDSCIVCVQSCRKAEAFVEQTREKRSYMCLYVAHSSTQTCSHTFNTSTMHTKNALQSGIKVEYKAVRDEEFAGEKRKLICSALSKMKVSELLMKTNTSHCIHTNILPHYIEYLECEHTHAHLHTH